MKKKGMMLLEETLKIILAVVCIVVLVLLIVLIYFAITNADHLTQAKYSIGRISDTITSIKANEISYGSVDGLNPISWDLISFTGNYKKPNSCAGINCLCICKSASSLSSDILLKYILKDQIERCNKNGYCLNEKNLSQFETISIDKKALTDINITQEGGFIVIKRIIK